MPPTAGTTDDTTSSCSDTSPSLSDHSSTATQITIQVSDDKGPQVSMLDLRSNGAEETDQGQWQLLELPKYNHLKRLNLADNKLTSLPLAIGKLFTLEVLNVSANKLTCLPADIWKLSRLERLHADFNNISQLSEEYAVISNIKCLTLGYNDFAELSPTLGKLNSLHTLLLCGNTISSFPEKTTEGLSHLRHLDISHNKLKGEINISRLKNLIYLDVSHNDIESLQMSPSSSLENFNGSYNKFQCITLHSKNLRSVLCHHNGLLHVQFSGFLEQLEELGVSHNHLATLPFELCTATKLQTIDVRHNAISELPVDFFKKKRPLLSIVKLGNNHIKQLPELTKEITLRKLLLENNLLVELPEAFFDYLPRLDELNITNNQITELPLPKYKQNLSLRKLFLSANGLRDNVFEFLRFCPRLQVLHVGYNLLSKLPDQIFKATPDLQQMSLAGNRFRSVENLSNIPKLQSLYLHSNKLTTVPNFSSYDSLRVLDISCTKLNKVNLAFLVTPDLCHLDISFNKNLQVESNDFQHLCTKRNVAVVDVSCSGRTAPPSDKGTLHPSCKENPFEIALTESYGSRDRLIVVPLDSLSSKHSLLIAAVESEGYVDDVNLVRGTLLQFLKEEKQEKSGVFLKKVFMKFLKHVQSNGSTLNTRITLCMLTLKLINKETVYSLYVTTTGGATCVLGRKNDVAVLSQHQLPSKDLELERYSAITAGFNGSTSKEGIDLKAVACNRNVIPHLQVHEIDLRLDDKFLLIGSGVITETFCEEDLIRKINGFNKRQKVVKYLAEVTTASSSGRRPPSVAIIAFHLEGQRTNLTDSSKLLGLFSKEGKHNCEHKSGNDLSGGGQHGEDVGEFGETYKSWEYVLEQNHKLLFTRELETINSSFIRQSMHRLYAQNATIGCDDPAVLPTYGISSHPADSASTRGRVHCQKHSTQI
ncbi:uncharacterized protein LOC143239632 [Tachypleus tridentatus]|uniref:uncharacterized protein LOC143239632 n=1 Tax=Tachypleus tridentatus TaxID=6853 RepID=UPI003FD6868A